MSAMARLRRLRGKSFRYIVVRGFTELRRAAATPLQRRTLARLSTGEVLSAIGAESAAAYVRDWAASGPFHAAREASRIRTWYAARPSLVAPLRQRALCALAREHDVLGTGPVSLGETIAWRRDYRTGYEWPLTPSHRLDYALLHLPCDVKIPWELSRFQHLFPLGQLWLLERDPRAPREFQAQVDSWLADNPVGLGPNWACTMDVALRAWSVLWLASVFADASELDEAFWARLIRMLWQHGQWMPEHLEKGDVNGNHYISDALGLVACGAFFRQTAAGSQWADAGTAILEHEIALQVEPDGVDIEASVPYQRLVMEIFLAGRQLIEFTGRKASARYDQRLRAAADFVAAYTTPQGLTPVVGDADDGRVMKFGRQEVRDHRYLIDLVSGVAGGPRLVSGDAAEEAVWFLASAECSTLSTRPVRVAAPCSLFATGGAAVLRSDAQYCFMDIGDVGLRGLGGHGHNDVLSFEWHAFGRPVLTDSGAFVYTASPEWRNQFRATDYHTALRIDGEEVNRFYGPLSLWNLHNDARAIGVRSLPPTDDSYGVEAGHTGYQRLPDPVNVTRRIEMRTSECVLVVTDHVAASATHALEWYFQIAEGWHGSVKGDVLVLEHPGSERVTISGKGVKGAWSRHEGWFSPSYGVRRERERWRFAAQSIGNIEQTWTLAAHAATHS